MKRNCICLSCKNLLERFIKEGKLKYLFQLETEETIEGDLLNGETDVCPFDFYEKKDNDTCIYDDMVPVHEFYAGIPPKPVPSYSCESCSRYANRSCEAFPEGIPCGIIIVYGHKEKLPGQNNDIVYEWKKDDD